MEPLVARLIVQAAPRSRNHSARNLALLRPQQHQLCTGRVTAILASQWRNRNTFSTSSQAPVAEKKHFDSQAAPDSSYSQPATQLSQNVTQAETDHFQRVEQQSKIQQTRSPWTRQGSDLPPVARNRSAGAMTKGKLLTTPSRMLKLILPITTKDLNGDRKDVEPLALLVHPQQPLSYLERLIQSELPLIWDEHKQRERAPDIIFRAEDSDDDAAEKPERLEAAQAKEEELDKADRKEKEQEDAAREKKEAKQKLAQERQDESQRESDSVVDAEETRIDGKVARTGKIGGGGSSPSPSPSPPGTAPRDKRLFHDPSHSHFVRWSPSTEIGDFIRDAARAKEFAIDIEGAPEPTYVGVPSFADRTYYLRMRLRKVAARISTWADVKADCDRLARRGAKQVAQAGFLGLIGWWGAVYYLTFRTSLGWDVMEPVTYLVGLSGLIGGYLWFLYHNREASYQSAMHVTVTRRQHALYAQKGFRLPHWEALIDEGNLLRREIKMIADEYDVEWDETKDEGDVRVRDALRAERKKSEKRTGTDEEGDGEEGEKEK